MKRITVLIVLIVAAACSASGQAFPAGNTISTRWLIEAQLGSETGLGFKLPSSAIGTTIERSLGNHFEFHQGIFYSPDKKIVTNNGNSLLVRTTGIYFVNRRFGVTAGLTRSLLWTSQFNEASWIPKFGIVLRNNWFGDSGRLYLDYVVPMGCQWGASCPIQSKRLQGPEFTLEARVAQHVRFGFAFNVYHILNQSNELLPNTPRTGAWTGDSYAFLRFENLFGRTDPNY